MLSHNLYLTENFSLRWGIRTRAELLVWTVSHVGLFAVLVCSLGDVEATLTLKLATRVHSQETCTRFWLCVASISWYFAVGMLRCDGGWRLDVESVEEQHQDEGSYSIIVIIICSCCYCIGLSRYIAISTFSIIAVLNRFKPNLQAYSVPQNTSLWIFWAF